MINQSTDPLLQSFRWRSIGPIGQGGRVDDIAVNPQDATNFFVGFATGGLWRTTNNGTTFDPVFDTYETHSVGAVAIAPSSPNVVYIGTGESNNRQSSSFGAGVYKSTDGGDSWAYVGLRETQSIARVRVHPTNPDVVWIAANGHLFGPNPERGVYKTTNGGQSWDLVLGPDEYTGATDLVVHPTNPDILFAATYTRQRSAFFFASGGPEDGIWRSTDGGSNWTRLEGNGLPRGTMGRIALDISQSNPQVVYAQIEVALDREPALPQAEQPAGGGRGGGRGGAAAAPNPQGSGVWRSDDGGNSWEFQSNENGRPMYFSQIRVDTENPDIVYVVDQNIHQSLDGGKTFEQLNGYGHVDQHAMWVDPADGRHLMIGNDGSLDISYDRGQSWQSVRTWAVGQPYHASVDMRRPYNVCTGLQDNGTWCGPSDVRGNAILAQDWYGAGGGDGFYTQIDPTDHNVVYSESQNGNINRYDMRTGQSGSIRPNAGGGRGGPGNIVPPPSEDAGQFRWNWNTPFLLSSHDPSTIYTGANRFFKSSNRGETWTMTGDLTKNIDRDELSIMGIESSRPRCRGSQGIPCILSRGDGTNTNSNIVSIGESSLTPSVLWVGTDDGNIQVSRNGGATWTEVGQNVPGGTMTYLVTRVEASHFDIATAYASLDGHNSDDLTPYVFVTRDFGQSWESIASNLPAFGNVNTIRQDPKNPDLLYAGTEFGFFVSLDDGRSWNQFMNDLPTVRIDDVLVHPRDNDLVLATHGRSIWIMDDVSALQQLTPEARVETAHLFAPREAVLWKNDRAYQRAVTGDQNWEGNVAPNGTAIRYHMARATTAGAQITITDAETGEVFASLNGPSAAGINHVQWNLRGDPPEGAAAGGGRGGGGGGGGRGGGQGPTATAGVYTVQLTVGGESYYSTVTVLEDIWMGQKFGG